MKLVYVSLLCETVLRSEITSLCGGNVPLLWWRSHFPQLFPSYDLTSTSLTLILIGPQSIPVNPDFPPLCIMYLHICINNGEVFMYIHIYWWNKLEIKRTFFSRFFFRPVGKGIAWIWLFHLYRGIFFAFNQFFLNCIMDSWLFIYYTKICNLFSVDLWSLICYDCDLSSTFFLMCHCQD